MTDTPSTDERTTSALLLAGATILVGWALQFENGTYTGGALFFVTLALGMCAGAVASPGMKPRAEVALAVIAAGLLVNLVLLASAPPGVYIKLERTAWNIPFRVAIVAAGALAMAGLAKKPFLGRAHMPAVLAAFLLLGLWFLAISPDPHIDVWVFQRDGVDWLLAGKNPYVETYPNIYPRNTRLYAPEFIVDGRVTLFPYPPLPLFLAIPGRLLGDVRYSLLAAMVLAAAFIAYARPGRVARAAVALLLFTPRSFFVLEQAWTEPFVVALLAATAFVALRHRRLLGPCLGLFLASKQYVVAVVPLVMLLAGARRLDWRRTLPILVVAAVVALAVSLPLILWDVRAAVGDIFLAQISQPFRDDALSYLPWLKKLGVTPPGVWLSFVLLLACAGLALWRAPRNPAGFCAGVSLMFLTFFAFNKQAFCNYYYFVVGALCCALGLVPDVTPAATERRPTERHGKKGKAKRAR